MRLSGDMPSKTVAQSVGRNASEPCFATQVCFNRGLATNKPCAQPRPARKPNWVGQTGYSSGTCPLHTITTQSVIVPFISMAHFGGTWAQHTNAPLALCGRKRSRQNFSIVSSWTRRAWQCQHTRRHQFQICTFCAFWTPRNSLGVASAAAVQESVKRSCLQTIHNLNTT